MRKILLTEEAAEELEQAALWYEQECIGLGERFTDAVESGLSLLKDDFPPLVPVDGEAGKKGVKKLSFINFLFLSLFYSAKMKWLLLPLRIRAGSLFIGLIV